MAKFADRLAGDTAAEIGAPLVKVEGQEKCFEFGQITIAQNLERSRAGCARSHRRGEKSVAIRRRDCRVVRSRGDCGNLRGCRSARRLRAHGREVFSGQPQLHDQSPRRDPLTGLPNERQLEQLVQASLDDSGSTSFTLLLIDIHDLKSINTTYGRTAGDQVLNHVVHHARHGLRMADILFRNTSDEFVAFLNATDSDTASVVAARICDRITEHPVRLSNGTSVPVEATVIAVRAPRDGRSLNDLLSSARRRGHRSNESENASVH